MGRRRGSGNEAGSEGRRILGTGMVESPYDRGEVEQVTRNLGESPADAMLARGDIDAAQHRADAAVRRLYEHLTIQRSGAIDPGREPVDVSGHAHGPGDRAIDAGRRLARVAAHLGKADYALVIAVSGEGHAIRAVAGRWEGADNPSARTRNYISRRYRDALSELARHFGFAR